MQISMQDSEPGARAYILQNTVSHARYLPSSSSHAFTYPTLSFLLSLSALESHKLDIGHGRLFGYTDAGSSSSSYAWWARATGIRPEAYLHDSSLRTSAQDKRQRNIREKLEDVLTRFGHDARELVDAWMMTMPSYLGVEGINPLTVFYCYKNAPGVNEAQLWLVVLEVHNTFGERHVYVLPIGPKHEDRDTPPGFTHSWTFPRQFHVSPFNDRSGYYTCSIIKPSQPPPSSFPSSSIKQPIQKASLSTIRIQLYSPDRKLKLTAALRPTSAVPLTTRNLLAVLSSYPLTLLLSSPRIAWQAFHLHYHRRLDVFARPEPRAVDPTLEEAFSGLTESEAGESQEEKDRRIGNEVQRDGGKLGVGGGVGWQPEGALERYTRCRVEQFIEARARLTGIRVRLISANPSSGGKTFPHYSGEHKPELRKPTQPEMRTDPRELTLIIRSSRAFLLILSSPSPALALLLGRDAERLFTVSDEKLFLELFSLPSGYKPDKMLVQRFLQWLRTRPIPRTLLTSSETELAIPSVHPLDVPLPLSHLSSSSSSSQSTSTLPRLGYLDALTHMLPTLLVLTISISLTYLEKAVFMSLGARFVRGTEPWGGWARAEEEWLTRAKNQTNIRSRLTSTEG